MPGGHSLSINAGFRAKRELHCIFHGKKAIIIICKRGTTIFILFHYIPFPGKLKEKLAQKARVNTERVFSYLEKGCPKKCTRQSPKVLWVVLSSLFFKKFERTARSREAIDVSLRMLKESINRRFDSCIVRNSVLIISHITFRNCRACRFLPITFLKIAVSDRAHAPWSSHSLNLINSIWPP